jgi:hypothetical protein
MGCIRYRKGVSDLRHLLCTLVDAEVPGALIGVSIEPTYPLRQPVFRYTAMSYDHSTSITLLAAHRVREGPALQL